MYRERMLQADSCTKTSKQEENEATRGGKLYRERMLQADSCTKTSNQEGNEATGGGKLYRERMYKSSPNLCVNSSFSYIEFLCSFYLQ